MAKEPQSYGSEKDWVTGDVGQTVNRQKSTPGPEEADFYNDETMSQETGPHKGGHVSDFQLEENEQPEAGATADEQQPIGKVTDQKSGAKRGGYFKDRDYRP